MKDKNLLAIMASKNFTNEALISAGYSLSDLRSAGYSLSDLISAGYSLSALISAGYSASALISAGYSLSDLRSAGYSLSDLISAGYSLSDLISAGYSLSALISAGYSLSDLRSAGYSLSDLISAGYSASALNKIEKLIEAIPMVEKPYTKIWNDIQENKRLFKQSSFGPETMPDEKHVCETPMCTGGNLVNLAGAAGYALKNAVGWPEAASLIHQKWCPELPEQNYGTIPDEWALAFIEKNAERENNPVKQK